MLKTGPRGLLLGFLVYLRDGQLVLPALATEGEHLARCGVRPLQDELTSQVTGAEVLSFSPQVLTGAVSTIKFFLSEAFLGQHFEAAELEGDLFLFRLLSPTGRWCGAHVGVDCGHGEIIHFGGVGGHEFDCGLGVILCPPECAWGLQKWSLNCFCKDEFGDPQHCNTAPPSVPGFPSTARGSIRGCVWNERSP
ncbi:uncharacterized protein LOC144382821 [Halichoerus grypus]